MSNKRAHFIKYFHVALVETEVVEIEALFFIQHYFSHSGMRWEDQVIACMENT
jgi:hypothetical protein